MHNPSNSGSKKRRSFLALLFAAGYGRRYANIWGQNIWPGSAVRHGSYELLEYALSGLWCWELLSKVVYQQFLKRRSGLIYLSQLHL